MSQTDALEAADALLAGSCGPAKTAAHVAALHAFTIHGDAPAQAAVRGALAADLAPLTVLLSALVCGKKVRGLSAKRLHTCPRKSTCLLYTGRSVSL
jgi:hypothetical protein